jgi:hypothetical protein
MWWLSQRLARIRELIGHEILNSRGPSKKGLPLQRLAYNADGEEGDRSVRAIKSGLGHGKLDMNRELKTNACLICRRKVQPTHN